MWEGGKEGWFSFSKWPGLYTCGCLVVLDRLTCVTRRARDSGPAQPNNQQRLGIYKAGPKSEFPKSSFFLSATWAEDEAQVVSRGWQCFGPGLIPV